MYVFVSSLIKLEFRTQVFITSWHLIVLVNEFIQKFSLGKLHHLEMKEYLLCLSFSNLFFQLCLPSKFHCKCLGLSDFRLWKKDKVSFLGSMNSMQTCNSVTFYLILFHEKSNFLILAGSAFDQIWLGR